AMLLWQIVRSNGPGSPREPEISYSQFMADVDAGKVESVSIAGTQIRGRYRHGSGAFHLTGPSDPKIVMDALQQKGVEFSFHDPGTVSGPAQLLGTWAPLILLGALWFFMIRKMQRRGPGPPASPSSNAPINPV